MSDDYPDCNVCGEPVEFGIGDPSNVWWHPECFRQVVRRGGIIPPSEPAGGAVGPGEAE